MNTHEIVEECAARKDSNRLYREFLRLPSCSVGVYELPAGGIDPQGPHTEDEVYFVIKGRATVRVEQEDREIQAGSVILVGAGEPHHFHGIREDLTLLVFFAPAESV